MTLSDEERSDTPSCRLLDLPDDVIYVLLTYCDIKTLGRLASVCQRLSYLVRQDCVWLSWKRRFTCVAESGTDRCSGAKSVREQCRVARNWTEGKFHDQRCVYYSVRQLPWMQMDDRHLWISNKNFIHCYAVPTGKTARTRRHGMWQVTKTVHGSEGDMCRFVNKDGIILSGTSEGSLCAFSAATADTLCYYRRCHMGDVHSVDMFGDTAVSGSRDATVKIWRLYRDQSESLLHTISTGDRVWSVTVSPNGRFLVAGTAAINQRAPLQLWDVGSGQPLQPLGSQYKLGAGVLDMQFESVNTLLTCGYDTFIRLWDLRMPPAKYAACWEEPYDSALYCLQSDGNNAFLVGTARHGMVRLWDKRKTASVQMYYVGRGNSPVFSLSFDSSRIFVALDFGIHVLDFR